MAPRCAEPGFEAWARGLTTTYRYRGEDPGDPGDPCAPRTGELRRITYNDPTPEITFTYNRVGARAEVTDAAGKSIALR